MATITPVAYYTGSTIPGTTKVGNLSVGTTAQDYGVIGANNGITYVSSPNQSGGYIIAHEALGRGVASGATGTANVGFWRTPAKTDQSFLNFVNALFLQNLADASAAKTYLNNNGYWTDWAPSGPPPFTGNVGDLYGGGIVGYIYQSGDPGYDAGTQHGIIISVNNSNNPSGVDLFSVPGQTQSNNQLPNNPYPTNGTSSNLGSGDENTLWLYNNPTILVPPPGPWDPPGAENYQWVVVNAARAYRGGGFSDWAIPSSTDVSRISNTIYNNILEPSGWGAYWYTSTIDGFYDNNDPVGVGGVFAKVVTYYVGNQDINTNTSAYSNSNGRVFLVRYF